MWRLIMLLEVTYQIFFWLSQHYLSFKIVLLTFTIKFPNSNLKLFLIVFIKDNTLWFLFTNGQTASSHTASNFSAFGYCNTQFFPTKLLSTFPKLALLQLPSNSIVTLTWSILKSVQNKMLSI